MYCLNAAIKQMAESFVKNADHRSLVNQANSRRRKPEVLQNKQQSSLAHLSWPS